MHDLSFRPLANDDIQGIFDYYHAINPKLADAFISDLGDSIRHIQNRPKSCQKRTENIRSTFLDRFKYGVYFKIYKMEIAIIAVLHTSRNPQIWKKR